MARLSARQQALLTALKSAETAGLPLDPASLAAETGYSPSSIRTYFTKKLDGVLVVRDQSGCWRARGALRCDATTFARHMSQNAGARGEALQTEAAWRTVVRKLLYEGQRRQYTLGPDEAQLATALLADEDTQATKDQPGLFSDHGVPLPAPSSPRE